MGAGESIVGGSSVYRGGGAPDNHPIVPPETAGVSLEARIVAGRPLSVREAQAVLVSVLRALAPLHDPPARGLHGSITPADVVLEAGGRVRLVNAGAPIDPTMAGAATQRYAAPEQLRGDACPASDLYALGLTIVVAMSGRPLEELRVEETGKLLLSRALPAVAPPGLRAALDRMIEPDVGKRASSASELLLTLAAPPQGEPKKRGYIASAVGLGLLAGLIGFWLGEELTPRPVVVAPPPVVSASPPVAVAMGEVLPGSSPGVTPMGTVGPPHYPWPLHNFLHEHRHHESVVPRTSADGAPRVSRPPVVKAGWSTSLWHGPPLQQVSPVATYSATTPPVIRAVNKLPHPARTAFSPQIPAGGDVTTTTPVFERRTTGVVSLAGTVDPPPSPGSKDPPLLP